MSILSTLITYSESQYYDLLASQLTGVSTVLDIGCGASSPLRNVPKTFHSVGVDLYKPSIEQSKRTGIHDEYIIGDVTQIQTLVGKRVFDAVIALDLIEHLTRRQGSELMRRMERLAVKKVIIMTPNGYYNQDPFEGNPHQIHKSGWTVADFQKSGFHVYGLRGLKWLRGEYATLRFKPWFFWGTISVFTQPVVYYVPSLAYQLLAVKTIQK